MPGPMRTRLTATLLAGALAVASVAAVRAETAQWSLAISPGTVAVGEAETFALTVTNQDPQADDVSSSEIGCIVVDVPAIFSVTAARFTGSNAGNSWTVGLDGNRVLIRAGSGGDRLASLQWVRAGVDANANGAGSPKWQATAYRDQGCSGTGAPVSGQPAVVVTGPVVTPSPVATPKPTPKPTPTPTPAPASTARPTPRPTTPAATATPTPSSDVLPTDRPDTTPTPTPTPTASDSRSDVPGTAAAGGPPAGGAVDETGATLPGNVPVAPTGIEDADDAPHIAFEGVELDIGLGAIDLMAGAAVWVVPAATIAVPGMLLLLLVALQAAGALAWIPAVRRLRGRDAPKPR